MSKMPTTVQIIPERGIPLLSFATKFLPNSGASKTAHGFPGGLGRGILVLGGGRVQGR